MMTSVPDTLVSLLVFLGENIIHEKATLKILPVDSILKMFNLDF